MSEPTLVTQDPNEVITPPTPGRRRAARVAIVASIALTAAALTTVFYRSFAVIEPTSAVIVIADPSFDGAEIVVRPDVLSPSYPESRAILSADNNYQTPVLLRPGDYLITITLDGNVILKDKFPVQAFKGRQYLLGKAADQKNPPPKTRPAPPSTARRNADSSRSSAQE